MDTFVTKAARLNGPRDIELIERELVCGEDDIIVKNHLMGICGSDKNFYRGYLPPKTAEFRQDPKFPFLLGHESGGTVVAVGSRVADYKVGDKVMAFGWNNNFAEYFAAKSFQLQPVPYGLDMDIASLGEPISCAMYSGLNSGVQLGDTVVVMGGGVIGLELACAFAAYGTEITVVEMMPELMPNEQKEAVRIVLNDLKKQGISLKTGAKMLRIEKNGGLLRAVYEIDGKEESTDCEQVLMAAGRKTNLSGIDAEALGLKLDGKKCIVVDAHQRTSLPGVYAIGDVVGGFQLAHVAYAEGEAALADMLGEDRPYGTVPVPVCTYTIPCFASVGLTTQRAKEAGYEPVLGSFDYSANGMALAEGAAGAVFVVADKATTKTLGVTIVGENSSEMIAMATSAVADGLTTDQWEKMVVAHPSLCEMVREAALDAFGRSVHKG